ncbi:alpha/beta fold hydrolase [Streptomyces sp. NPDC004609]|uniref:esterase/lipase family protein n=1 Tax=Streptomyces sp. NPDC004609 TaxID=3364704 RepID=UPI0036C13AD2
MLTASLETVRRLGNVCDLRVPTVVLRATALELAILAGHVLLYPSGLTQERPGADLAQDPGPPGAAGTPRPPDAARTPGSPRKRDRGQGGDQRAASDRKQAADRGPSQDRDPVQDRSAAEAVPPPPPGSGAPDARKLKAAPPRARGPETGIAEPTPLPVPLAADGHPGHPPVVLLHGFVDNRSVFVLLRRSLSRHGWRHLECLNYSPLTCDIRAAAELLGRHIEEICARTGRSEVDIVGHSLGGLIARYYAQCLGGDLRVRTVVTLGTPHSGTTVAPLASAHPIVRQMRPDSDVIEELRGPAPGCRTRFVSFWSDLDQLMTPVETARVEHPDLITENVQVSGIGHLALPVHPAVAARIRQCLEGSESETGTPGAVSVA